LNRFDRVFLLHRYLSNRRTGISFGALQDEFEWSRSTLRRTLMYLRDTLNAPLIHDPERGGYYYDKTGVHELPGIWFTAEELAALLILDNVLEQQPLGQLAEALKPFRAKLERQLQASGINPPDWSSRLRLLRMAGRPTGTQFPTVANALISRCRLSIDYHARHNDRMSARIVSPQRLTLYRENWYLDAWCHQRDDLRTFSIDRIIAAEALDQPAQECPSAQLNTILATSYGIFSGQPNAIAILRFSAHIARWVAAETWHPEQKDEHLEDGSLTRSLPYHHSEELLLDILRHGSDVEVLAPEALRAGVAARLRAALSRYEIDSRRMMKSSANPVDLKKNTPGEKAGPAREPGAVYPAHEGSPIRRRAKP
jgi:predicted DNA-binding transcriptional regulator YafY